jgi:hypothetical protein
MESVEINNNTETRNNPNTEMEVVRLLLFKTEAERFIRPEVVRLLVVAVSLGSLLIDRSKFPSMAAVFVNVWLESFGGDDDVWEEEVATTP